MPGSIRAARISTPRPQGFSNRRKLRVFVSSVVGLVGDRPENCRIDAISCNASSIAGRPARISSASVSRSVPNSQDIWFAAFAPCFRGPFRHLFPAMAGLLCPVDQSQGKSVPWSHRPLHLSTSRHASAAAPAHGRSAWSQRSKIRPQTSRARRAAGVGLQRLTQSRVRLLDCRRANRRR